MNIDKLRLALIFLLYLPIHSFAQGGGPPPPGDPDPTPTFSINQEIWILLVAGLLFGFFIIKAKRKL